MVLIFEVLVVVVVTVGMMRITDEFGKSDAVIKINAASDLAMMINALAGVPGDGVVMYPQNMLKYTVWISENKVTVTKKDEPENLHKFSTFNLPANHEAFGSVEEKDFICLQKITNEDQKQIILMDCHDYNLNAAQPAAP